MRCLEQSVVAACKKRLVNLPGHSVMSEEKPETKDGLGKNIENSICDDFGIDISNAGSIGNTPDT